ncbi:MAG: hypothetical protein EOP06_23090 [Proteobacteria bacterium]|nr:MAG: hypothetical protein EOP06_23090 [Pseudomonadota bacterium]
MNTQIIEHGIALMYKDLLKDFNIDHRALAHEYLEKICQNIWHLPLPASSADFLESSLLELGKKKPIAIQASSRKSFFASVVNVVRQDNYVAPNPRRVKLFANLLDRMFEHHPVQYWAEERDRNAQLALVFGFLYLSDQPVYRILQTRPAFYNEILLRWARNPGDKNLEGYAALRTLRPSLNSTNPDESQPTPSGTPLVEAYSDPTEEGVMRVQSLIVALGELESDEVRRYILQ